MIIAYITDEDGNRVQYKGNPPDEYLDENDLLSGIILGLPKHDYEVIHHIDPWGDTVLNSFQTELLTKDIDELIIMTKNEKVISVLKTIRHLAELCRLDVHQYLKFFGD